jgi:Tol biopolymer transport system component
VVSKRLHRLLFLGLALCLTTVFCPNSASATTSAGNDRLTFMRQDAAGFEQVWVSRIDLTDAHQLTHGNANSGWPVWSPNGRKIAFDSDRGDPDTADATPINDIFTMNADGSGVTNLTGSKSFNGDAGWSPDGKMIAFDSDAGSPPSGQGIYVMDADGGHRRRVTQLPATATSDLAPRFAPDGAHLVFTRFGSGSDFSDSAIFTVDVTGRHPIQRTDFTIGAGDAVWSPDGRHIAFEAYVDASSTGDIVVMKSDGTELRHLTHGYSADPVWSPDGRTILFVHGAVRDNQVSTGLATMKPDGSDVQFVSPTLTLEHQPDWTSGPRRT